MKRIIVLILLFTPAIASPRRVVHFVTLGELCPGSKDWESTNTCLQHQGKPTLLRDLPEAKLVRFPDTHRFAGAYLYVYATNTWRIAGQLARPNFELLSFEPIKNGYRFDIGIAEPSALSFDNETSVPILMRYRMAMMCTGTPMSCREIGTSCDAFVRGKAYYFFRGTIKAEGNEFRLIGDRTNAGDVCPLQ